MVCSTPRMTSWACRLAVAVTVIAFAVAGASAPKNKIPAIGGGVDPTVTIQKRAVTLEELLPELDPQARQQLTVEPEVRWDQVTLSVRKRAASRVRAELAELLNYAWEREPRQHNKQAAGQASKRLTLRAARALASEAGLRQQWYSAQADELLRYAAYARRPPKYYQRLQEQLRKQQPKDPYLRSPAVMAALTNPGRRAALLLLLALSREQLLDLVTADEQSYYLPWREMSPIQRELAEEIAAELAAPNPEYRSLPRAREFVKAMGLVLLSRTWEGTTRPSTYLVQMGNTVLNCGYWITPRPAPTQESPDVRGRPYPSTAAPRRRPVSDDETAYNDLEKQPFPARGFRQEFPSTWPEVFDQLAARLPLALYADYSPTGVVGVDASRYVTATEPVELPRVLPLERMSVAQALDALCARYKKVWWRHSDAIFFRSRTWYLDRPYQVPLPVLTALREQLQARGRLDAQGLNLLARLTSTQIIGLHRLAEEEWRSPVPWLGVQDAMFRLFRVYQQFSEAQKSRSLTEAGLLFGTMTPTQQRAYREALFVAGAPEPLIDAPPPFQVRQVVHPGVLGRRASLGEVAFWIPEVDTRRGVGAVHIPFPVAEPREESCERS